MLAVGVLVGFSFSNGVLEILAGVGLLLLFGYAFSWVFAYLGLSASSAESAQALGFIAVFPLTFASSAFVPTDSMPSWLEAFADANPITTVVDAIRALWLGRPGGHRRVDGRPLVARADRRVRHAVGGALPPGRGEVAASGR